MRRGPWRAAQLCAALALVAFVAYQPHWRPTEEPFPYPVHLDEYVHWGYAREIQRSGAAEPEEPFGRDADAFGGDGGRSAYDVHIHERGFQSFLAALQQTSGIAWISLLQYIPVVVALFLALCIYLLAERHDAGVEAVLWLAAVPTTLRFLGPGFVVPIYFALPLVFLALGLARDHRTPRAWLAIGVLAAASWTLHAMAALLLMFLVLGYMLAQRIGWRGVWTAAAAVLPTLLAWPYYSEFLKAPIVEPMLPASTQILRAIGPTVLILAALGTAHLAVRREASGRGIGYALGALLLLMLVVLVLRHVRGDDIFRLYDRTATTFAVVAAALAGIGTSALLGAGRALARPLPRHVGSVAVVLAVLAVQATIAVAAVGASDDQPYYRVLDDARHDAFASVPALVGAEYTRAIVDGPHGLVWTAVTGIPTAHVQWPGSAAQAPEAEEFFAGGAADTPFLIARGVSLVVTDRPVTNAHLTEVLPSVYALDREILMRMMPPSPS